MYHNCPNINETRTLKTTYGTLDRIVINTTGSAGSRIKLYDSLTGSGRLIADIDCSKVDPRIYDIEFDTGLTYVTTNNPGNLTISYD